MSEFVTSGEKLLEIVKSRGSWLIVDIAGSDGYVIDLIIDGKRVCRYTGYYRYKTNSFKLFVSHSFEPGSWGNIASVDAFKVKRSA